MAANSSGQTSQPVGAKLSGETTRAGSQGAAPSAGAERTDKEPKRAAVERLVQKDAGKNGLLQETIIERWTDEKGQRFERLTHPNGKTTTTKIEELRYYWGRFQAQGSKADPVLAKAWFNGGVGRQWKRMELVIVPSTYLGVFGIANQERFQMLPNEPLKRLAPYNPYGFMVDMSQGNRGEATEEEYRKRLDQGTVHNRQQQTAQAATLVGSPAPVPGA